ncbi:MAG: hypothetical protein AAB647_00525 [Patescibacteria group bacterium]
MGHEPMDMEVEAGSDDEAMMMMVEKCKAHLGEGHADMNMSDDEMKQFIMDKWQKSDM